MQQQVLQRRQAAGRMGQLRAAWPRAATVVVQASSSAAAQPSTSFMPAPQLAQVQEPAAQAMASGYRRVPVVVPGLSQQPVNTAFVGPTPEQLAAYPPDAPAVVMLHGFDSSSMEFRRLYPLLAQRVPTYAVDLVGWGFTDAALFAAEPAKALSPGDKREHLFRFWKEVLGGRSMVLVGASLGGAVALDFAAEHPEAVSKLVLIDAQGFIDGIGPMSTMPRFLAVLGVQVLRTEGLRMAANKMAYHDKQRYATEDAMRIGRLHTFMPGWLDANVAFMKSGGYAISTKIPQVQTETLILWGRNDEILEPTNADKFASTLPRSRLVWVDACGHCPHLEQPQLTAQQIFEFVGVTEPVVEKVAA